MKLNVCFDYDYSRQKICVKTDRFIFIGAVFLENKLQLEQDIIDVIGGINSVEDAVEFVKRLNGNFALLMRIEGKIFLATDRERTIPLFYKVDGDDIYVYNRISLETIRLQGINEQALAEFENCLFVSGEKTLAEGISAVSAGQVVVFENGNVSKQYYFEFDFSKEDRPDKDSLLKEIDEKFVEAIERLIAYLNGRCAVVPLSGGHDSRLIVYYLKKLGYNNIVTYTYGPKGNFEANTSEKVAKYLGLNWHFVIYKPRLLKKLFKKSFKSLSDYCINGTSSICIQDWYAIDWLHKNGTVPDDAVFVPGHSFDCIAGSFILPKFVENSTVTKRQLIDDIILKHYSEGKRPLPSDKFTYYNNLIVDNLLNDVPDDIPSDRAFNLYQNYNVRERQAKYICAQPKIYEYYGYDWYMPLWDKELIDFWETIDINSKFNRKLFFEFTNYKYSELMEAAPVENEKSKNLKKVNMNPLVRVARKINQLINYVDFHYCLAYFTRFDVYSIFFRKKVLNIGYFVNQKIIKIIKEYKND